MRIAINTGGGDAPGLNAVIRAVVLSAHQRGWEVFGIEDGYLGLLSDDEDGVIPLGPREVRGITHRGGTILGTTNRGSPLEFPVELPDGTIELQDRGDEVVRRFRLGRLLFGLKTGAIAASPAPSGPVVAATPSTGRPAQ